MATAAGKANEGTLVIDLRSLQLPAATLDRIAASVQKAVMLELASVDEAPAFSVAMSRPKGQLLDIFKDFGRTRGITFEREILR